MYWRFLREAGLQFHQVGVEKPQQLAIEREFGGLGAAPGRYVDARTVIPGPQQQMLVAVRQGQEARNRAVLVAGAVHPAGDRQDRDIARDLMGVMTRAERGRREFRIVGQAIVVIAELGDKSWHSEIG